MSEKPVLRTVELLESWQRKSRISQRAHYFVARRLVRRNCLIGVPAVILSGALGSGLLVTTQTSLSVHWRIGAGIAGVAAAVLTAIQMSANLFGAAERHRSTGAHFDSLSREIEQSLAVCPLSEEIPLQTVELIRKELDSLSERAPALAPELLEERRSSSVSEVNRTRRYEDSPFNTTSS
ncbi:SLATT domain-containing protein [Granulicella arctica]|uniref:SLATT domain-containing protein n=1 Tax=Granulicella arctica TaxID=940613 RepID=UPI0021E0379B|nr:SLATT domain-containing protein [Granulicella arctica]